MFKKNKNNRIIADVIILAVFILTVVTAFLLINKARIERVPDYSSRDSWAYFSIGDDKDVDLFLIAPTVYTGNRDNMSLGENKSLAKFTAALNMERGIYEDECRMYAPFYRQATMSTYSLNSIDREQYLEIAYEDISQAFKWYLENENNGRPIILAGFSQGADMCLRLVKDYFDDEELYGQLVAVYSIGWSFDEEDVLQYPQMVPASSADDTGVIICFDCETDEVRDSFICPAGRTHYCINPLNWRTDSAFAGAGENLGACFTDKDGNITEEIPQFCGGYIDTDRGVIKITGIDTEIYSNPVPSLPDGSLHVYDYMFYYRNLQANVKNRIEKYQSK